MIWTYCVNAVVAGALGAGTNELAIIAILRYILPRKKSEIARRVRDIIANDLMSPDKMRDKLNEPQITDLLYKNIDQTLCDLLERDLPAPAVLLADHMNEVDALAARLRDSLLDEVTGRCNAPDFAVFNIRPFLVERWHILRHRSPASLLSGRAKQLADFVQQWATSLEHSAALKRNLRRTLAEWLAARLEKANCMADILPPNLVAAVEELVVAQTPAIVEQIADALRQPNVRDAISAAIMAAINEQLRNQGVLGGIKGALVNAMRIENDVQGICQRLPDTLRDNLASDDNREQFALLLKGAIRHGLHQPLTAEYRSPGKREMFVNMLIGRLWTSNTFSEMGGRVRTLTEEAMRRSIQETIIKLGIEASGDALLDEASVRCQRILTSDATRELLARQFEELLEVWKAKPLGRFGRFIKNESRARTAGIVASEVREMIRLRLDSFAEEAGVWDIVTDSIEGYDNKQIADMVVQLARNELRWVTILGGVIGVLVGVFQTFLQS